MVMVVVTEAADMMNITAAEVEDLAAAMAEEEAKLY